ncbi:MAG: trypsin-like peptidase domain-containing protein [Planctomycetota bacterium]
MQFWPPHRSRLARGLAGAACFASTALLAPAATAIDLAAQLAPPQSPALVERSSPLQVAEPSESERALRTTPVVRAVQRAADSVVSVYLRTQLTSRESRPEGQGSGVLLDDSGLVITNWHVIAPVLLAERRGIDVGVTIKLRDGRTRDARLLSSSPKRDLALLQMKLRGDERVKPIEIGVSSDLMIGETVIAIGNPQGHANTVTTGVLSATGRSIQVRAPDGVVREYTDLLQTDAAINQGNSGGALLDITGRLVGINNAMSAGAENIGFAIPMDVVRGEFQRELLASSSFVASGNAPWLGLEVADRDGRVVVREVTQGGPAAIAGVQTGDVLVRIGDRKVATSIDYLREFFGLDSMRNVPLVVERSGKERRLTADAMPRHEGTVLAAMGARVETIDLEQDRELIRKATLAFYRGSTLRRVPLLSGVLRLERVLEGSPAAKTGLERGDLLLGVIAKGRYGDRELPLASPLDLARLLTESQGKGLRLIVLRGDRDLVGTVQVRSFDGRSK